MVLFHQVPITFLSIIDMLAVACWKNRFYNFGRKLSDWFWCGIFLSERINSYIQYGWDELLLKDPNGKIQEEKRKENVNAEERLLATTFFDALNSSGNLCLEYANSNKTWLKLQQKHILITTSPNYSYL